MQWGFTLGSGESMLQQIVEVPDGAYPPSVGEKVHFTKGIIGGTLTVKSRLFHAEMPQDELSRKLVLGWSFLLESER